MIAKSFITMALMLLWPHCVSEAQLVEKTRDLETMFIDDCENDTTPHGFYGAFLEPCEFAFFQGKGADACATGRLIGQPQPVHWLFKLQDHIDKDDWESISSDDMPDFEELMLWPDQCVAVTPRCYELGVRTSIDDTLSKLFPDGIPSNSTHVRVDCRVDALELSRVINSVSMGLDKIMPAIFALIAVLILFTIVALSCCVYGCCRLCNTPLTRKYDVNYSEYEAVPITTTHEGFDDSKKLYAYQSA